MRSHDNGTITTTHETGHFLGLSDRYSDNKESGASEPHEGFKNDIMGDNSRNLAQAHYDDIGSFALAKKQAGEKKIEIRGAIDTNRKSSIPSKK